MMEVKSASLARQKVGQPKHINPELQKRLDAIAANRGMMKGKVKSLTPEEDERLKREAGNEFFAEMETKFNRK